MSTVSHTGSDRSTPVDPGSGSVRVWDLFVRVFHWTVFTAFFVAYFTEEDMITVHVWAGYVVGVMVALRIVWGFVGPRHARFAEFAYGPGKVLGYLRDLIAFRARRYIGHSPAGGAMVIALIVGLVCIVATGLVLYGLDQGGGPFAALQGYGGRPFRRTFKEIHELLANFVLALVVAHVAGVLLASFAHRENLVKAMFTGRKRSPDGDH